MAKQRFEQGASRTQSRSFAAGAHFFASFAVISSLLGDWSGRLRSEYRYTFIITAG